MMSNKIFKYYTETFADIKDFNKIFDELSALKSFSTKLKLVRMNIFSHYTKKIIIITAPILSEPEHKN